MKGGRRYAEDHSRDALRAAAGGLCRARGGSARLLFNGFRRPGRVRAGGGKYELLHGGVLRPALTGGGSPGGL